jgi:3-oxoadipate enol-lactonase
MAKGVRVLSDRPDGNRRLIPITGGLLACHLSGDGLPLIMLHPPVCDSRIWRPQRPALGSQYALIAIDQRGHGDSAVPTGSYDPAADVAQALGVLEVDRPVVLAAGGAAETALRLAARRDLRVRGVVVAAPEVGSLVASIVGPDFLSERLPQVMSAPEMESLFNAVWEHDLERIVRLLSEDPRALSPGHPARALVREMVRDNAENTYRAHLVKALAPADIEQLVGLDVPVLALMGEQTGADLVSKALSTYLDDLTEVEFPTGVNLMNLELPDQFNHAVLAFLARVPY